MEDPELPFEDETPSFQIVRPGQDEEEIIEPLAGNTEGAALEVVRNESEEGDVHHFTIDEPYDPTLDLPRYQMPPLSLLEEYDDGKQEVSPS